MLSLSKYEPLKIAAFLRPMDALTLTVSNILRNSGKKVNIFFSRLALEISHRLRVNVKELKALEESRYPAITG